MFEIIVLVAIGIGIYKRGGRRFELSRSTVGSAAEDLPRDAERLVGRGRRSLPGLLGRCVADMRELIDDMLGLIDPRARRRIEARARKMMARAESRLAHAGGGSRLATVGQSGAGRYQALQKSYLEGSISLEHYVQEAERLRAPR